MEADPRETPIEVLPPDRAPLAQREQPATLALRAFLFTAPPLVPVDPPTFTRTDCEGSFAHRFGIAVIASWRWFQFYLSPSGAFSAFLKVFLRWFIALLALVLLVGIPAVIAAQFLDSVGQLLESAARHFMWACIYLVAGCLIISAVIATLMIFARSRK